MIQVRLRGRLPFPPRQREAFLKAADRWNSVITSRPAPVRVPLPDGGAEDVEGLAIDASLEAIDGVGKVLASAGPTSIRIGGPYDGLPITGQMRFDTADLDELERNGTLDGVILHEMGHVLGFGTLFERLGLIREIGLNNPVFEGPRAIREYAALMGNAEAKPVPLANTGGPGTRAGHWRESLFGDELMTGYVDAVMPLSRMSIAAFEDIGYEVDYEQAEEFTPPTLQELVELGIFAAVTEDPVPHMEVQRPTPIEVPVDE